MSNDKSGSRRNSFNATYGRYLSERIMQPIDLETIDLDASTLDPELPIGGPCCSSVGSINKIATDRS